MAHNSTPTYKGSEFIRLAVGSSKDILTVVLEPDVLYTEEHVTTKVNEYLTKEVKK